MPTEPPIPTDDGDEIPPLPSPLIADDDSPDTTDEIDLGQFVSIYAIVNWQKMEGGRWVNHYNTLTASFSTTATVQEVEDYFAEMGSEMVEGSGGVLVSIEVTSPAYFQYFQGF